MRQRRSAGYNPPRPAAAANVNYSPLRDTNNALSSVAWDYSGIPTPPEMTLEEFHQSWGFCANSVFLTVMDYLPYNISSRFIPTIEPQHVTMLSALSDAYVRPYDAAHNQPLLERLWYAFGRLCFDDKSFSVRHSRWKEMGFQSEDPTTDFRGTGLFGLSLLVYMLEKHPRQWSRTMAADDFLTAAAGLNVAMRLMSLLQISRGVTIHTVQLSKGYVVGYAKTRLCQYIFNPDVNVAFERLGEVFCAIMRLLHLRWEQSSKNLMELNQMLNEVYADSERLLWMCDSWHLFCSLV